MVERECRVVYGVECRVVYRVECRVEWECGEGVKKGGEVV